MFAMTLEPVDWSSYAAAWPARCDHALVALGTRLLVFGGVAKGRWALQDVWCSEAQLLGLALQLLGMFARRIVVFSWCCIGAWYSCMFWLACSLCGGVMIAFSCCLFSRSSSVGSPT